MPEIPATPEAHRRGRARKVSAVPRSVVMGLDRIERTVSFVGAGLALIMALLIPLLVSKTITLTSKPTASKACPTGYHLVGTLCSLTRATRVSDWILKFAVIAVIGVVMAYFSYRRKRAGVAFGALLLGLAIGTIGLPYLMLGGWLVIRALRLQKYGDPTFAGSSQRAREAAKARREGRSVSPAGASSSRAVTPPQPSKRYTPKKPPRKR